jgi:hypothetical protein
VHIGFFKNEMVVKKSDIPLAFLFIEKAKYWQTLILILRFVAVVGS